MQIKNFDMQLSQSQDRQTLKKRISGTATGVAAIAIVTCITLLLVNSGSKTAQSEELNVYIPSQNLRTEFIIEQTHFNQILKFQRNSGINIESIVNMVSGISDGDAKLIERTITLIVQYSFDLIDSNDDQVVSKAEWDSFFKALYPQDLEYFQKEFAAINGGKDFKIEQYKANLLKKFQNQSTAPAPQFKTPQKVTQVAFGKLIINDSNNYKKTYNVIFNIFDVNGDKSLKKTEYIRVLQTFGVAPAKASQEGNKLFAFAKDNKLSEDGNSINYDDYVKFSEAMKKPLQDLLNSQKTFLLNEQLKQQNLLASIDSSVYQVYQTTLNTVFDQLSALESANTQLTPEQQKVFDHVLDTILDYEFSVADANDDKILTQAEAKALVDSIFKKDADRTHFYQEFNDINGGKDVTHAQFIEHYKKEQLGEQDDEEYKPKEKGKKIGQRLAKFIVNSDRNYELTYNFLFNLFDLNNDKVVSVTEIHSMVSVFSVPQQQLAQFEQNVKNSFQQLKKYGVGDGEQITYVQWSDFAKKIRSELLKVIKNKTFFFVSMIKPSFDF